MHSNAALLHTLFTALDTHDHKKMAECYHPDATFSDIAFNLTGRKQIHAMWHMISTTDIRATFEVVNVDEATGLVHLVDDYTFSDTGYAVHNVIESNFKFRHGLIIEHADSCDALTWARMAFGGLKGEIAGRFHFLRSRAASGKLKKFVASHQEYA